MLYLSRPFRAHGIKSSGSAFRVLCPKKILTPILNKIQKIVKNENTIAVDQFDLKCFAVEIFDQKQDVAKGIYLKVK